MSFEQSKFKINFNNVSVENYPQWFSKTSEALEGILIQHRFRVPEIQFDILLNLKLMKFL